MRRIWISCLAVCMICVVSGTAGASMVTVLRGESAPGAVLSGQAAKGTVVLTFGNDKVVIHEQPLKGTGVPPIHQDLARDKLYLIRDLRAVKDRSGYEVLYSHSGFHLARVEKPGELAGIRRLSIKPVKGSRVVTERATFAKSLPDPVINQILSLLEESSYEGFLSSLAEDLQTRYLCTQEILGARDLIKKHFESLGLETYVVKFSGSCWPKRCTAPNGYNVIGIKRGQSKPNRFCLVGAHYDSINEDSPCGQAPGANDNGSGVAGVMELARVFSKVDTEASIVFVAFSGEEQGMYGSKALAKSMVSAKPLANLKASNLKSFMVMDMIAYYKENYGVLVEASNNSAKQKAAAAKLVRLGRTYTDLEIEKTFDYEGSDHQPFLDRGMAGALLIESDWGNYDYYHSADDRMEYQDIPFAIQILRLAAAMLATGTGASLPWILTK